MVMTMMVRNISSPAVKPTRRRRRMRLFPPLLKIWKRCSSDWGSVRQWLRS